MRTSWFDRGIKGRAGSSRVEPSGTFAPDSVFGCRSQSKRLRIRETSGRLCSFRTDFDCLLTASSSSSLTVSRTNDHQKPATKEKIILPAVKFNQFTHHTTSYTIRNPAGDLFTYTPSGKVRPHTPHNTHKLFPQIRQGWLSRINITSNQI